MTTREEILRAFVGERPCVICGQPASLAYPFVDDCFPDSWFKDGFIRVEGPWVSGPIIYRAICDQCQGKRHYVGPEPIHSLLPIERKNDKSEK